MQGQFLFCVMVGMLLFCRACTFWKTFVFLEFSLLENLVNTERLCTFVELLFQKVLLLHLFGFLNNNRNFKNTVEQKTYTFEEAQNATLEYFGGDALAARVWANKYAMKDSAGKIYEETPADMHWRIANEIARVESKYPNALSAQELFDLLDHFKYIVPQGSPMTGIGNNHQIASLSNCFVIGMDGYAD